MSAHQLIETDIELIIKALQDNFKAALAEISAIRNDSDIKTALPEPKEYFRYEKASGYRPPCVFVIADNIDFSLNQGKNYISSRNRINICVLVEDLKDANLTYMAYRYQAAAFGILQNMPFQTADGSVKIVVNITDATFSTTYTNAQQKNNAAGVFRKEILLRCEVEHYEKLS